jgi:hypothetical protein
VNVVPAPGDVVLGVSFGSCRSPVFGPFRRLRLAGGLRVGLRLSKPQTCLLRRETTTPTPVLMNRHSRAPMPARAWSAIGSNGELF